MQKTSLIERMAELFNDKKLPLVAEFRDESTEDVRIVIEPKSRTVDAGILMESLFKLTELESRIPLNMNVLSKGKVPKVMGLAEVLKEWLDHRREVLVRRSKHRLAQIEHRLEVLGGFLVAYLNLDKVIKIIRNEDEPKPVLMKTFKLSDVQADAILNMRLRNLRKLEEMEIKRENKELREEKPRSRSCSAPRRSSGRRSPTRSRRCARSSARRRRSASAAPTSPKRPSTTRRRSKRRWSCASRSPSWCRRRAGSARCAAIRPTFRASRSRPTTGRSSRSRPRPRRRSWCSPPTAASTPSMPSKLPGGRGHGEPVRLYADIEQDGDLVAVFRYQGGRKFLVASKTGRGFVVAEDECLANTRKGKQVLNVKPPDAARAVAPVEGELVAAIGENRKMVIFPLDQVPEMARGRGVRLQRHKDGGLSDVTTFKAADGLTWVGDGGRVSNLSIKELAAWRGNRGDAGRVRPDRFLANLKFGRLPENGKNGSGEEQIRRPACMRQAHHEHDRAVGFFQDRGRGIAEEQLLAGAALDAHDDEIVLALGHLLEDGLVGQLFRSHRGLGFDVVGVAERHDVLEDAVGAAARARLAAARAA